MRKSEEASAVTNALDVRGVFKVHCAIIAALIGLHIVVYLLAAQDSFVHFNDVRKVVDVDSEHGLANLLSAFALALCGMVALLAASRSAKYQGPVLARGWLLSAAVLLFVAIDEGAALHDTLSGRVGPALGLGKLSGIFFSGWVIPYLALALIVSLVLLRFALALPADTKVRLVMAAALYVGAAIGMELPEGSTVDQYLAAGGAAGTENDLASMMIMHAVEEAGEMIAVALALRAMLLHLVEHLPGTALGLVYRRSEQLTFTPSKARWR